MRTIAVKVYTFNELPQPIQDKVIEQFRNNNEYVYLTDEMLEHLKGLLKEESIEIENNDRLKVLYSLSNSQGDGAMFEGVFGLGNFSFDVRHQGRYTHSNSKTLRVYDLDGSTPDKEVWDTAYDMFDRVYVNICTKLARFGYGCIEQEDSEQSIKDTIEINEYEFYGNGEIISEAIGN